jgi:ribosomal protein S18 acetylase RimI-like enzyme
MSKAVVSFREATAADYDVVCVLCAELDRFHREARPSLFRDPGWPPRDRAFFQSMLNDGAVLIAEAARQPVGMAVLKLKTGPATPVRAERSFVELDSLVVLPQYEGQGIGQQLMHQAETWTRRKGMRALELSVWAFNERAARFYDRSGYDVQVQRRAKSL